MSELFLIIICFIILFGLLIYLLFSNYNTRIKAPFYLLLIFLLTYVIYVVATFWSSPEDPQGLNESKNILEIFRRVFFIYGEYLLIIIGSFLLLLVFYQIFMGAIKFSLTKSIWVSFGIVILFLALIKNSFYENAPDSELVTLIKDVIFYIPCLITDSIDFLIKDYSETPTSTFIVFIIIIIYFFIFFILPLMNKDGGYLLITGPQELNVSKSFSTQDILFLTNKEIQSYTSDFSYNSITITPSPVIKTYLRDKLTKNIETFSLTPKPTRAPAPTSAPKTAISYAPQTFDKTYQGSLIEKDTHHNFKFNFGQKINDKTIHSFDIKELYNEMSNNISKQWSKITSKFTQLKNNIFPEKIKSPYIYNYSYSFWLYINTFHFKKLAPNMQTILSFGKNLNIMYDNINNELVLLLEDEEQYRSKGILYQRWNHIVINSRDSNIDLFINNNLVGTYKYKNASSIDLNNTLTIGSTNNSNFGSICNFRYYTNILELNKILSIYKKYNKKNPPI